MVGHSVFLDLQDSVNSGLRFRLVICLISLRPHAAICNMSLLWGSWECVGCTLYSPQAARTPRGTHHPLNQDHMAESWCCAIAERPSGSISKPFQSPSPCLCSKLCCLMFY